MKRASQQGYAMVSVLFILALGVLLSASMLGLTSSGIKTRALVKTQAQYNYECEETLNKVAAWLQENSKNLVYPFTAANFDNNFVIDVPTAGKNEGQFFDVPSVIKVKGTDESALLSNNDFLGEPAFPATQHIDTGASFDAVSEFRNADLGSANARALLMWARESDGNYAPIFRVDAVTGNNPDRGAHMFTYVYTQLTVADGSGGGSGDGIGFYTESHDFETKNGNNECYSYMWTWDGTAWDKGAPRSNCVVASKRNILLESRINGDTLSLLSGGVQIDRPNGEVSGTVCEGPNCHSHTLSPFDDWSTTCGAHSQGSKVVSANETLSSGPNLSDQCWEVIEVQSGVTLTLDDTTNPYRFKTLTFQNNSNSRLNIPVLPPGQKVTLYVDNFDGGRINGNQMYNTNNAPRAFEVNITSDASFKLNGTAEMHAHFIAPLAYIEHNGTFEFHGAIEADRIYISGNGTFNYDEGIGMTAGPPPVTDFTVTLKKAGQRYR